MSVICLGKACLDKVMPFLDSILSSDDLDEIPSIQTMDRPLTFKRNMELISNVSDVLRKRLSMNESLETILSHILDLLRRIDRGAIILRDTRSGRITEVLSQHKDGSRGDSLSFSRTIVKRVLKEGKAFRVLDTFGVPSEELSKSIEMMRIKSALCVPMISRSQVRGAIYLDSIKEPNGFRKDDLILITTLGNSAAIAVENALLCAGRPGESLN
jgi:GAF domain-containing protein